MRWSFSSSSIINTSDSLRVLILGDSQAGKSTLIKILTGDPTVSSLYQPTYGCNLAVAKHQIAEREVWIELLEVGGRARHNSSNSPFYRKYDGIIAMFATDIDASFSSIEKWLLNAGVSMQPGSEVPILIVGTKIDVPKGFFGSVTPWERSPFMETVTLMGWPLVPANLLAGIDVSVINQFYNRAYKRAQSSINESHHSLTID